jgi:DNA polymerase II large subunit
MIQIQRPEQFTRAATRATRERQFVRRYEPHVYEVTNKAKAHTYLVRFEQRHGQTFGSCTCEAGTPTRGQRVPLVCKHLFAAVLFVRALRQMRQQTSH